LTLEGCPVAEEERILLAHGDGGALTRELVSDLFMKHFDNEILRRLDDSAVISPGDGRLAFTTDAFVVKPLFFPGGDLGKLAVCGTVNDLAVAGAEPLFLSVAFTIEEGLPLEALERVARSMGEAARSAGVSIVAADTKVVGRGEADGVFVSVSGIGRIPNAVVLGHDRVKPGDALILNGSVGEHGMAILAAREELGVSSDSLQSDCAALGKMLSELARTVKGIRFMRDPTRGGLATVAAELAEASGHDVVLDEQRIPVLPEARGLCEMLGLDPLYMANEGKALVVCASEDVDRALAVMRKHPEGRGAVESGRIMPESGTPTGRAFLRTSLGGTRPLGLLTGENVPRIC